MKVWEARRFDRGIYTAGHVLWKQIRITHQFVVVKINKTIYTDKKFFKNVSKTKDMERHILWDLNKSTGQALAILPYVQLTYPDRNLWLNVSAIDEHTQTVIDDVFIGCGKYDIEPGFRVKAEDLDKITWPARSRLWIISDKEPTDYYIWEHGKGFVWFGYGRQLVRKCKS